MPDLPSRRWCAGPRTSPRNSNQHSCDPLRFGSPERFHYTWKRADFPNLHEHNAANHRGLGRPVIQNCDCRDDVDVLPPPPCRVRSSRRVDGNDAPISSRQSARNAEVLPICNLRLTAIIVRRLYDCNSGGSSCNNASLPSLWGGEHAELLPELIPFQRVRTKLAER